MPAHLLSLPLSIRPAAIARFLGQIPAATALARSRRSLALLDDHLLRDIGLTRAEALAEADRTAWDAPSHWKA